MSSSTAGCRVPSPRLPRSKTYQPAPGTSPFSPRRGSEEGSDQAGESRSAARENPSPVRATAQAPLRGPRSAALGLSLAATERRWALVSIPRRFHVPVFRLHPGGRSSRHRRGLRFFGQGLREHRHDPRRLGRGELRESRGSHGRARPFRPDRRRASAPAGSPREGRQYGPGLRRRRPRRSRLPLLDAGGRASRAERATSAVESVEPGPAERGRGQRSGRRSELLAGGQGFLFVQLWWPTFQAPSSSSSSIVPY